MARDTFLNGPGAHFLQKVWGDEARQAALAARRNGGGGNAFAAPATAPDPAAANTVPDDNATVPMNPNSGAPADQSTQGGAVSHDVAHAAGWEHMGAHGDQSGAQVYSHAAKPEDMLTIHPSGEWNHTGPGGLDVKGQNDSDLTQYLTHLHGQTAAAQPSEQPDKEYQHPASKPGYNAAQRIA